METQRIYQESIKFAGFHHAKINQLVPGTELPYVVHLSNVAMEILIAHPNSTPFDLNFAIQLALLHDVLEDTEATFEEIEKRFGFRIANGIKALTKNENLPKSEKMQDSLNRIKQQPKEVWMVKMADRITNLQTPPSHWSSEKIANYKLEAIEILNQLKEANTYLSQRLANQIEIYG